MFRVIYTDFDQTVEFETENELEAYEYAIANSMDITEDDRRIDSVSLPEGRGFVFKEYEPIRFYQPLMDSAQPNDGHGYSIVEV